MGRAVYITKELKEEIRRIDETLRMMQSINVQPPIAKDMMATLRLFIRRLRVAVDKSTSYRSPKEKD